MGKKYCGDDIGELSSLSLGGGGIGAIWGETSRAKAIETVKHAVSRGINLLDMAPMYGRDREAERVIGEAFDGKLPKGVKVLTKYFIGNKKASEVEAKVRRSLQKSLQLMKLDSVDFLILHSSIVPDDWISPLTSENSFLGGDVATRWSTYVHGWIPCAEKLKREGLIKNWGITGIGEPSTVIKALQHNPKPRLVEVIANCYDMLGSLKFFQGPSMPRTIIQKAVESDVLVLGIRAVAAGSLCDEIDRPLEMDTPEQIDWYKAKAFRELAKEKGVSAAYLAHRYSLSMPGVTSVVIGVKNKQELDECIESAEHGSLSSEEIQEIDSISAFSRL